MSFFKRLSVTVKSQMDAAISRVENHDAIIEATLQSSRDAIARLKQQLNRTRREIGKINEQLDTLQVKVTDWTRRAQQLADTNEEEALACLGRRDRCQEQIEQLQQQKQKSTDMEDRLNDQLGRLGRKLASDEQRLREYRGRDLSIRAEQATNEVGSMGAQDLEQAFDRWDLEITRAELSSSEAVICDGDQDPLEERFLREERLQVLHEELHSLKKEADHENQ